MNDANTNVCRAGSSKITTEATCEAAAAFLGTPYSGFTLLGQRSSRPSGCYVYKDITFQSTSPPTVYFNPGATGAAFPDAKPLCNVTGAPPPCTPQGYRGRSTLWSSTALVAQGHASTLRVLVRAPASTERCIQCPASAQASVFPIPLGIGARVRESSWVPPFHVVDPLGVCSRSASTPLRLCRLAFASKRLLCRYI